MAAIDDAFKSVKAGNKAKKNAFFTKVGDVGQYPDGPQVDGGLKDGRSSLKQGYEFNHKGEQLDVIRRATSKNGELSSNVTPDGQRLRGPMKPIPGAKPIAKAPAADEIIGYEAVKEKKAPVKNTGDKLGEAVKYGKTLPPKSKGLWNFANKLGVAGAAADVASSSKLMSDLSTNMKRGKPVASSYADWQQGKPVTPYKPENN